MPDFVHQVHCSHLYPYEPMSGSVVSKESGGLSCLSQYSADTRVMNLGNLEVDITYVDVVFAITAVILGVFFL